ncbi:HEAT repeat domain-containing protein [Sphingopyxis kveilinensis]|uniref:HEAT repeat domain-containing protein n=1 Tax=Sphingopyxis kveilinensis TaxID=3114367 RepID=UPI0030D10A2C
MPAPRSRHDHYPRDDAARCRRIREAVADLDAHWRKVDSAPADTAPTDTSRGGLLAAIEAVAGEPPDHAIARLLPWLTDTSWLHDRLGEALALLAADPFARPPLRPVGGGDDGSGGLIIAERGPVRVALHIHPAAAAAPTHAVFVPGRAAIRVLAAAGASLCLHEVAVSAAEEAGGFTASAAAACRSIPPRKLVDGEIFHHDTARQSYHLACAHGDVLLLELAVQPPAPLPFRSYDLATGRLAHVSASQRDASFRTMALTLLRHLGRPDAAPLFLAETQADDFALRWHAMRELIALAPAAALPRLAAMAATDPHPEVRRAAQATLALLQPPPASGRGSETCELAR